MLLLIPALILGEGGSELAALLIVVGCVYWLVSIFTHD